MWIVLLTTRLTTDPRCLIVLDPISTAATRS